jgi:hypothetical protein
MAAFGVISALLGVFVVQSTGHVHCYDVSNYDLQNLSGTSGTTGNFLGIDQEYNYNYFINMGDHFEHRIAAGSDGRVYEDNPQTPYVIYSQARPDDIWGWFVLWDNSYSSCYTDFHIPKGSVINTYRP